MTGLVFAELSAVLTFDKLSGLVLFYDSAVTGKTLPKQNAYLLCYLHKEGVL